MPQSTAIPETGTRMPDFAIVGVNGERSTLTAEREGRRTIVHFMRSSTCVVCVAHAKSISALVLSGEADAQFFVIAPGALADAITASRRIDSPAASVWASGESHAEVGLGKFLALQHSGTFVIAADGTVLDATVSAIPTKNYSREAVLRALA